ncbi:hypothetical protein OS122_04650 [Mycolicibacterium mucogenicum]|uniref:hypothetical protein n=1 Tax=Mycolicibacterium mucogenicum TaxID=56689 RepID=UPI00226A9844|nr:hypothetical protein [Mycolicibacterium mucogenicum]MCX8560181.1 hypothetical protein [Mycolicibacterium mucogenicum]
MRAAKTAIPAYLSRLTGTTAARSPQLRPPRPLFGPTVGDPLGPDPTGPVGAAASWTTTTSSGAKQDPPPQTRADPPSEPARPIPTSSRSEVKVADFPVAQPLSQPPAPTAAPRPPYPDAVRPSSGIDPASPPLRRAPAAPVTSPTVERVVAPHMMDSAPQARPPAPSALPTQAPPLPTQPDKRAPAPDERPESRSDPAEFDPPAAVAQLVPLRSEPDRPQSSAATAPAAPQVSIGTIEVLVTPPPQAPVPNLHQPAHAALPTHSGRAGTDVARRQARRWFGAGQS